MNDFERRMLDVIQNSSWIATVARKNANIIDIDYYVYNVEILDVAIGSNATGNIQTQSDSDFAMVYMAGETVVGGLIDSTPVETIQFTDTGTGKTFFNVPALFQLVMGNSGQPLFLPTPRVIGPNTNVNITVNAIASAGSAAIDNYISLMGARIYYG